MVRILMTLLIYLIGIIGYAQTNGSNDANTKLNSGQSIQVEINKIMADKGIVYFAIYDSKNNFENKKPLKVTNKKVEGNKVTIVFDHLKPGTYAITCYHDANNNGKMDFANNGIPMEDYGATNNVMNYGPPRFEDAKFVLKEKDLTFEIKL